MHVFTLYQIIDIEVRKIMQDRESQRERARERGGETEVVEL